MNIINKIRLNISFRELKELNLDDEILHQLLSNRKFRNQYPKIIKPYIQKQIEKNKYRPFGPNTSRIKENLVAINELSKTANAGKYINFISKTLHYEPIKNYQVLNDNNFDMLYAMIGEKIFEDNMFEIIKSGHSARIIEFIKANPNFNINRLDVSLFDDKVWEVISHNPMIGNHSVFEIIEDSQTLAFIIKNDLYEGLKYSYENIPESQNYITNRISSDKAALKQFSLSFIENIGIERMKLLYERNVFSAQNREEFEKIFRIADCGNYELIKDVIDCNPHDFIFCGIHNEDVDKSFVEVYKGDKKRAFLYKFFGFIEEPRYVKNFVDAINRMTELPETFKETYGDILQLINKIYMSTDKEIIEISKTINIDEEKRDKYKNMLTECEKEGNQIISENFTDVLQKQSQQIVQTAPHKKVKTANGTDIDVYEMTGQPFTMLVHAICDNNNSEHNHFVSRIINDPKNWTTINEGNNFISLSLISEQYMSTYAVPNDESVLMFGFDDFPSEALKYTATQDMGTNRKVKKEHKFNMRTYGIATDINTVISVDHLLEKTVEESANGGNMWNEVLMSRTNPVTGQKLKPNYIVCMDSISEGSKKAAEQYGVPIYLIHRDNYRKTSTVNVENRSVIVEEDEHKKR